MVSVEDNDKTVSIIEFGYEPVSVVCGSCSQKVGFVEIISLGWMDFQEFI